MLFRHFQDNFEELKRRLKNEIIVPISAKRGENLSVLLTEMRKIYDTQMTKRERQLEEDTAQVNNALA